MVSEIVMYQSMFVLGILTFGFFAVSFNNYSNYAEDITIENNLQRVLQEVGQEIVNLVAAGREARGTSSSLQIDISIQLESEYAGTPYAIEIHTTSDNFTNLVALVDDAVLVSHSLGLTSGTNPSLGQIDFSSTGTLFSQDNVPTITYIWNSNSGTEQIVFS